MLEICLTSNLHTGSVRSLRRHPFRRFHKAGVPASWRWRGGKIHIP